MVASRRSYYAVCPRPEVRKISARSGTPHASILISPYAVAHGIAHEPEEHGSIIKLVGALFNLIPLADLGRSPRSRARQDRIRAKSSGTIRRPTDFVGDMTSGFDTLRLLGKAPPHYPVTPSSPTSTSPLFHMGEVPDAKPIGVVPTDWKLLNPAQGLSFNVQAG